MDRLKPLILAVMLIAGLVVAHAALAAAPEVNLVGPVGVVHADDLVPLDIQLSSGGAVMNAAELTLRYSVQDVRVDHIERAQSVFSLWPEMPSWDNSQGSIHLVGGQPGGLVSINALLATVYFRANRPGITTVSLDPSASGMYLNDGAGTKILLGGTSIQLTLNDPLAPSIPITSVTHPKPDTWYPTSTVKLNWPTDAGTQYSYVFSADPAVLPDGTVQANSGNVMYDHLRDGRYYFTIERRTGTGPWTDLTQRRILIDTTPPAPFAILHPQPNDVQGADVITWSTTDGTSGVAGAMLSINGRQQGPVASPLRLQPSWRGKTLAVTVRDEAGNTQSDSWVYPGRIGLPLEWLGGGFSMLVVIGAGLLWFWKHRRLGGRRRR